MITTDIFGNKLHDEKVKIADFVLKIPSSLSIYVTKFLFLYIIACFAKESKKMGVVEPIKKEECKY